MIQRKEVRQALTRVHSHTRTHMHVTYTSLKFLNRFDNISMLKSSSLLQNLCFKRKKIKAY